MTGFGSASLRDRRLALEVEVRSVNHRFLALKQSLPEGLGRHESEIEQMARAKLSRGSVTLNVSVKSGKSDGPALPDVGTFKAVAKRLQEVRKALGMKDPIEMEDLLAIPSLWSNGAAAADETLWPKVKKLVPQAIDALAETRTREGAKIARALKDHLAAIEGQLERVAVRVPAVVEAYQKRLDERIRQLMEQKGIEAARPDIVKEVAIHADRCDTSEEIQRLRAHLGEFRKIMAQEGPVGRRLDFLGQEMGREINTIASKGNDGEVASAAVVMKAELEKIKEQVENIE